MDLKEFKIQLKHFEENSLFNFFQKETDSTYFLKVSPSIAPYLSLNCSVDFESKIALPSVVVRTTSWDYAGERSDLHDIYSILLAIWLRLTLENTFSFSVWDEPNSFSRIPSELYARELFISQPQDTLISFDKNLINILRALADGVLEFVYIRNLCFKSQCIKEIPEVYDWKKSAAWARKVAKILKEDKKSSSVTYNRRKNPHWNFYRSVISRISIVGNKDMCTNLYLLFKKFKIERVQKIGSINGTIFHSKQMVYNFIDFDTLNEIERILNSLNKKIKDEFFIVPLENVVVAFSKYYLVFLYRDLSKKSFEKEREFLFQRHQKESEVLFPEFNYSWAEKINDNEFETFIKELLAREKNIVWVRKSGHSRERDGGRDLIGEIMTKPLDKEEADKKKSLLIQRKVVIQCKAVSKPLSKSDVTDIRDTIDNFDSDGFFLITSSYLKGSLTTYLDKLRQRKEFYIDWWTKPEIEERVKKYPDLLKKYSSIFIKNGS